MTTRTFDPIVPEEGIEEEQELSSANFLRTIGMTDLAEVLVDLWRLRKVVCRRSDVYETLVNDVLKKAKQVGVSLVAGRRGRGFDKALARIMRVFHEHYAVIDQATQAILSLKRVPKKHLVEIEPIMIQACKGMMATLEMFQKGTAGKVIRSARLGAESLLVDLSRTLMSLGHQAASKLEMLALGYSNFSPRAHIDWGRADRGMIYNYVKTIGKKFSRIDQPEVTKYLTDVENELIEIMKVRAFHIDKHDLGGTELALDIVNSEVVVEIYSSGRQSLDQIGRTLRMSESVMAMLGYRDPAHVALSTGSWYSKIGTGYKWVANKIRSEVKDEENRAGALKLGTDGYDVLTVKAGEKRRALAEGKLAEENAKLVEVQHEIASDPGVINAEKRKVMAEALKAEMEAESIALDNIKKKKDLYDNFKEDLKETVEGNGYFHLSISTVDFSIEILYHDGKVLRIVDDQIVESSGLMDQDPPS